MSKFEQEHEEEVCDDVQDDDVQDEIKELLVRGREQGFLTYEEINEALPDILPEGDKYDEIIALLVEIGIDVVESPLDGDSVIASDDEDELPNTVSINEAEIGRTTDPVRMYMREMGAVDLLTREGEIAIAKRIEAGLDTVQATLARFPPAVSALIEEFERIEANDGRLSDLVNSYGDPYADKEELILNGEEEESALTETDSEDDEDEAVEISAGNNNDNLLNEAREKLSELAVLQKS